MLFTLRLYNKVGSIYMTTKPQCKLGLKCKKAAKRKKWISFSLQLYNKTCFAPISSRKTCLTDKTNHPVKKG